MAERQHLERVVRHHRVMVWRGLLVLSGLALLVSGCGGTTAAEPTPTAVATLAAASTPPATRPAVSPSASPSAAAAVAQPTNTPAVVRANTVYVGNTDGEGVYVRNTPVMADRAKAYPDGTALTVVGDDVDGDGQHWKHIKTPDGQEGYVPSMYTVATPP